MVKDLRQNANRLRALPPEILCHFKATVGVNANQPIGAKLDVRYFPAQKGMRKLAKKICGIICHSGNRYRYSKTELPPMKLPYENFKTTVSPFPG